MNDTALSGALVGKASAPVVVLLHAFPLDRRMWRPLIQHVIPRRGSSADGPRVLTVDLPGFGSSAQPSSPPTLGYCADAAVDALRRFTGLSRAVWVGCSMGGYVAAAIAERHPDAIAGLGMVNTRVTADTPEAAQGRLAAATAREQQVQLEGPGELVEPLVGRADGGRRSVVAPLADIVADQSGAAFAWAQRAMAVRPDRTEALRALGVPAVVVVGERDHIVPRADADDMAEALGVPVTEVPGVGHLSPCEDPWAVATALAPLWIPR